VKQVEQAKSPRLAKFADCSARDQKKGKRNQDGQNDQRASPHIEHYHFPRDRKDQSVNRPSYPSD